MPLPIKGGHPVWRRDDRRCTWEWHGDARRRRGSWTGGSRRIEPPCWNFIQRKVREQMRKSDNHGFPAEVDNYAGEGTTSSLTGGDRIVRTKVELRGSYKGKDGTFEWIIEPDRTINHRYFNPDP